MKIDNEVKNSFTQWIMKKGFPPIYMIGVFLTLFVFLSASQADQLIFKNGRVMNGTVIKETPSHVTISISGGSVKINRSKLKEIKKGTLPTAKQKKINPDDILQIKHAPKDLVPLAKEFRKLLAKRREAKNAQYQMGKYQLQITACEKKNQTLLKKILYGKSLITAFQNEIAKIKIPKQTPTQKAAITEFNALLIKKEQLKEKRDSVHAAILTLDQKRIKIIKERQKAQEFYFKSMAPINIYFADLQKFYAFYEKEKQKKLNSTSSKQIKTFFARMDRYVIQFQKEAPTTKITSRKQNGVTLVHAVLNGTISGEFILDTGASNMMINETCAQRLGINTAKLPIHEVILANGHRIKVKYSRLKSVAVGDATVNNLIVEIVPNSPNQHESGLLGMSFLKNFAIRLNGATGEIELMHFMPQR